MTLAQKLRAVRVEAGLSQRELARKSGMSRTYLADIEAGTCLPSRKCCEKIAAVLDVSSQVFLAYDPRLHILEVAEHLRACPEMATVIVALCLKVRAGKLQVAELALLAS